MKNVTLDQDEETILIYEIRDEALEAAARPWGIGPESNSTPVCAYRKIAPGELTRKGLTCAQSVSLQCNS
jgi:hypothetical protein